MRKMPNSASNAPNLTENPSVLDIKVSWRLLKQNIKSFLGIAAFSLGSTFLFIIVLIVIILVILFNLYDSLADFEDIYAKLLTYIMIPGELFILWGFFGSGYGLAYDIMSSGDGFAESKSGFVYFRKFWWQYIVLAVLANFSVLFVILPVFDISTMAFWQQFIYFLSIYGLNFITNTIFFLTFPSLTAQGSFLDCLKENFDILRKEFKRVLKTMTLLYLIFNLPLVLLTILFLAYFNSNGGSFDTVATIINIIATLIGYCIVNPMWHLVGTRVYNCFIDMDESVSIQKLF